MHCKLQKTSSFTFQKELLNWAFIWIHNLIEPSFGHIIWPSRFWEDMDETQEKEVKCLSECAILLLPCKDMCWGPPEIGQASNWKSYGPFQSISILTQVSWHHQCHELGIYSQNTSWTLETWSLVKQETLIDLPVQEIPLASQGIQSYFRLGITFFISRKMLLVPSQGAIMKVSLGITELVFPDLPKLFENQTMVLWRPLWIGPQLALLQWPWLRNNSDTYSCY